MTVPIHEGGFIVVESLPAGRYFFFDRRGIAEEINLSVMRAYQSQNLLKYAPTIISDIVAIPGFEVENLTSNLEVRTTRWNVNPVEDAFGNKTTDFESCFRFDVASQDPSSLDPFFATTFHFADEVFVNALLLVNDVRYGKLGEQTV